MTSKHMLISGCTSAMVRKQPLGDMVLSFKPESVQVCMAGLDRDPDAAINREVWSIGLDMSFWHRCRRHIAMVTVIRRSLITISVCVDQC